MGKRYASCLLLVAFSVLGHAHAAETLRQAVAAAIARFPEIESAQHRREAVQAQVGQARAELWPAVNASLGEGRERSRNVSTRAAPGDEVTLSRREADLSVTQLLFDGGAARGQVRRFAARAESAEHVVSGTREDVALRTGQIFLEVLRLREQLAIARENIAIHERTLGDVTALADAGRGRRADVTQAEARRSLAASAADQLAGQLAQAEAGFKYLVGRPPGALAGTAGVADRISHGLHEALKHALSTHPLVRAAEKEVEAAQHDRESARARVAAPRVTVEAGASRNRDIDGLAGPNQDRYAMLRLRYNLFRGFGDSERVRETEARFAEAVSELGRVKNEIERDVRQAWEALAANRNRLPQLARYAAASADVAEAYRLQFQLGQRSLLDVLNAENERYNASGALTAGRVAVALDGLRLLATQGRLIEALEIERPSGSTGEPPITVVTAARSTSCEPAAAEQCVRLKLALDIAPGALSEPHGHAERGLQ